MNFLLIKARLIRQEFSQLETQSLALKSICHNRRLPKTFRWEASLLLSKLLKRYSKVLIKNRCFLSGRSRGYFRFFNLSRIRVRELARNNDLPFITKSTW